VKQYQLITGNDRRARDWAVHSSAAARKGTAWRLGDVQMAFVLAGHLSSFVCRPRHKPPVSCFPSFHRIETACHSAASVTEFRDHTKEKFVSRPRFSLYAVHLSVLPFPNLPGRVIGIYD